MPKRKKSLPERLTECADHLGVVCECDGRGCWVCEAIDLLQEAAEAIIAGGC